MHDYPEALKEYAENKNHMLNSFNFIINFGMKTLDTSRYHETWEIQNTQRNWKCRCKIKFFCK